MNHLEEWPHGKQQPAFANRENKGVGDMGDVGFGARDLQAVCIDEESSQLGWSNLR
jgi:hypothetical protein